MVTNIRCQCISIDRIYIYIHKVKIMQSSRSDREQMCTYVNNILGSYGPAADLLPINADNCIDTLHDGVILCYLVNCLSTTGPIIKQSDLKKGKATLFHKLDQVNQALDAAKKVGLNIVNVRAQFIVEKKQNVIIGLFNQIKRQKPGPKGQIKKLQKTESTRVQKIEQNPTDSKVKQQSEGFILSTQQPEPSPQPNPIITNQELTQSKPVEQPQKLSKQAIQNMRINQRQTISQEAQAGYHFDKVVGPQAVVLVGSLRKGSVNKGIVDCLKQIKSRKFMDNIHFHVPDLSVLPIFNYDLVKQGRIPKAVHDLREIVKQSLGVLIATPEYNGTFSGIIKNAFDWLSDSWQNSQSPLSQKKIGIVSSSYLSQNQIRDIIEMGEYVKCNYYKQFFYASLRSGPFNMESGKLINSQQIDKLAYWYQNFSHFLISGQSQPQPIPRFIMDFQ